MQNRIRSFQSPRMHRENNEQNKQQTSYGKELSSQQNLKAKNTITDKTKREFTRYFTSTPILGTAGAKRREVANTLPPARKSLLNINFTQTNNRRQVKHINNNLKGIPARFSVYTSHTKTVKT